MLILRWILYTRVTAECMFWRFWGWFWDVWGVFGSSFVWHCSVRARFWCEASGKWWASFTTWIGSIGTRRTHGWRPFPRVAWLFRRCWTMFSTCSAHVQQVSTCWTLVSAKTFNIFQHLSTVSWLVQSLQHPTTCISSPQFLRHVLQIPMHHCHRLQRDLPGYCCR